MPGFELGKQSHRDSGTADLHRQAVERTIQAMNENLFDEISLKDMAKIGIMSPFHFNRVFRHVTGVPPARFLTARRIEVAKRLLVTTGLRITDICFEVGYNSLGTFTRRFTELVGLPPRHFRRLGLSGAESALEGLRSALKRPRPPAFWPDGVAGSVQAPPDLDGPIFVGLFPAAIPQSRPVSCAVLTAPGAFCLLRPPDGRYNLFAVGLPWSADPLMALLYESVLRGGSQQPLSIKDGKVRGSTRLTLRPPEPVDPPILMTLPLLLSERLASASLVVSEPRDFWEETSQ